MGDKRGDERVRRGSGSSGSRSLRQQKEGGENAKAVRSASRIIRPSSPFPLLDGNRSRKASLAVVDEDEDVDVRAGGSGSGSGNGGGEAERALHALLSDTGESLRVEDKTMTSSSREPWSSASSSVSSPEHSDSFSEGIEWSLRPISPKQQQQSHLHPVDADRASVISGPYYSARSSWRQSWQSALKTIKTGPSEGLSSHLDFSYIAAAAAPLTPS
jgi:hypothetical protein